jgi:hypothetical protein
MVVMATTTPTRRRKSNAVGYLVHSSDKHRQTAEAELRAYCAQANLALLGVFCDPRAPSRLQNFDARQGGAAAIHALGTLGARHLVIMRLHDAFPSVDDLGIQAQRLKRKRRHVHIVDLDGSPYSTPTDSCNAFWRLASELGRIADRNLRDSLANSVDAGKVAGWVRGGVPYGYDRRGKVLVENESEQRVIGELRKMREAGIPLNQLAARLNEQGIPSKRGGKWFPASVGQAIAPRQKYDVDSLWRPEDAPLLKDFNERREDRSAEKQNSRRR